MKVFVRAIYEANWMNEMEIIIYDSWFDHVCLPCMALFLMVFSISEKVVILRVEGGVSLEYLTTSLKSMRAGYSPLKLVIMEYYQSISFLVMSTTLYTLI